MKRLAEELRSILESASGEPSPSYDEGEGDGGEQAPCEEAGVPCWQLQEAAQFVAEDVAEMTGIDLEVLSVALTEAMKCDSACGEKYRTPKGDFKGGKGEAFATCQKYAESCCSGVKDSAAFCAYLGRRAGKI
jgi:hypothetical protein